MFFVKKEMVTFFGDVAWCYGTIVGSLFRGGSRIFLKGGGCTTKVWHLLRCQSVKTDWWRDVPNYHFYGVSHKFFNLVSCFTSTLTNHTVIFCARYLGEGGEGCALPAPFP